MSANKLVLLDPQQHKDLRVNTTNYNYQQNRKNMCVVMVSELSSLVHEYPIFITKNTKTGQFQLSAILGFESGENLYLQGNEWRAKYLPLDVLRRPFRLHLPEDAAVSGGALALDFSCPAFQLDVGERIFTESGEPSDYLKRIQSTFLALMKGNKQTQSILTIAQEYNLLEPITLNVDLIEQGKINLNGLYCFNQQAIADLTGSQLEKCHQSGLLQVCHLILSSSLHIEKLISWKRTQVNNITGVH